jgi:hypothetical protein
MLDFPSPATNGQQFSGAGVAWTWDGTKWLPSGAPLAAYMPLSGGVMTGALTPSPTAGLIGDTSGVDANVGSVGEMMSAINTTGVSLVGSSGTVATIASLTLTPGDWDVTGEVWFTPSGLTAGTNYCAYLGIGTPPSISGTRTNIVMGGNFTQQAVLPLRMCRISVSANTACNLSGSSLFTGTSVTATGVILARRAR